MYLSCVDHFFCTFIRDAYLLGFYCSGWVKRGPVGNTLNTMYDAFETAEVIAQDITEGTANSDHFIIVLI